VWHYAGPEALGTRLLEEKKEGCGRRGDLKEDDMECKSQQFDFTTHSLE
jgi:hypothetical protein